MRRFLSGILLMAIGAGLLSLVAGDWVIRVLFVLVAVRLIQYGWFLLEPTVRHHLPRM